MIYMPPIQKTFEKMYIYKFGRTRLKINEEIVLIKKNKKKNEMKFKFKLFCLDGFPGDLPEI